MNTREIILKQKIELAIKEVQRLKFDYVKSDLEITRDRIVTPYHLHVNKEGEPIGFYGIDSGKQGWRLFLYEGIQKLKVLDEVKDKDASTRKTNSN